MKQFLFSLIALCMLSSCAPTTYDMFASISGTVVDATTGSPIINATVTLSPTGKNVFTGSDGLFQFNDLDPTRYTVTVQKEGYESDFLSITVYAGQDEKISITLRKKN